MGKHGQCADVLLPSKRFASLKLWETKAAQGLGSSLTRDTVKQWQRQEQEATFPVSIIISHREEELPIRGGAWHKLSTPLPQARASPWGQAEGESGKQEAEL